MLDRMRKRKCFADKELEECASSAHHQHQVQNSLVQNHFIESKINQLQKQIIEEREDYSPNRTFNDIYAYFLEQSKAKQINLNTNNFFEALNTFSVYYTQLSNLSSLLGTSSYQSGLTSNFLQASNCNETVNQTKVDHHPNGTSIFNFLLNGSDEVSNLKNETDNKRYSPVNDADNSEKFTELRLDEAVKPNFDLKTHNSNPKKSKNFSVEALLGVVK